MNVSIRNVIAVAAISLIGGAAYADSCCTGFNGGITNIPTVTSTGSNCCGSLGSQVTAVPGVYVPGTATSTSLGGTSISSSSVTVGGNSYSNSTTYIGGNSSTSSTYLGGNTSSVYVYGGGGGGYYYAPGGNGNGSIDNLNVSGSGQQSKSVETRTSTELVPIRAMCLDDKGMPHPASRLSGDDKVDGNYNGEVYRCMAGTHMETTIGKMVNGQAVFDGGQALTCQKGQALSYSKGNMMCVAQSKSFDCYERSLLRRFGPGIKFLTLVRTQQFETQNSKETSFKSSMFVDGGVGQGVY